MAFETAGLLTNPKLKLGTDISAEIYFFFSPVESNRQRSIFYVTCPCFLFGRCRTQVGTIEIESVRSKDFAIDLRRVQQSIVAGNTVRNATKGIALVRDLRGNEVRDNSVEASEIAYSIEESLGDNKAGNNRIVGRPTSPWKTLRLKASDVVEP